MSYTVVHATGGRDNAEWHRCQPVRTLEEANIIRDDTTRGGRPAYVYETKILDWLGLPEGPSPHWDYTRLRWKKG
jgi:hypothetical protein